MKVVLVLCLFFLGICFFKTGVNGQELSRKSRKLQNQQDQGGSALNNVVSSTTTEDSISDFQIGKSLLVKIIYLENLMLPPTDCAMKMVA